MKSEMKFEDRYNLHEKKDESQNIREFNFDGYKIKLCFTKTCQQPLFGELNTSALLSKHS